MTTRGMIARGGVRGRDTPQEKAMRDSSLHFVSLGMTTKATADPSVAGGDLGMTSLSKGDGGILHFARNDDEKDAGLKPLRDSGQALRRAQGKPALG